MLDKIDTNISFLRYDELIYKKDSNDNTSFTFKRLCISTSLIKNILSMIHDKNHFDFDKTYQQIICAWYIQELTKHVKNYLKHCSKCKINQIKRHKLYESLQFIFTSFVSFHAIAIDFIFAMLVFYIDINCVMLITCKFSKRITSMLKKFTWIAAEWVEILL